MNVKNGLLNELATKLFLDHQITFSMLHVQEEIKRVIIN